MALAFRYSVRLDLCAADDAKRVSRLLKAAGLPTTLSDAGVTANGALLADYMRHDKKMSGGTLPFLLARGIGQTFLSKDVVLDDVAAFLDDEAQS
jgi:3-dehydroquinate synthase